jgi:hypothetical protein
MAAEVSRLRMFPLGNPTNVHFCTFLPERFPTSGVMSLGRDKSRREVPVHNRQINPQPEGVMADIYLGVTVTGLYTLVGMGLIIAFM